MSQSTLTRRKTSSLKSGFTNHFDVHTSDFAYAFNQAYFESVTGDIMRIVHILDPELNMHLKSQIGLL
jgi:hypothetical protein